MELPAGGGSKLVLVLGWCCCLVACFALLCSACLVAADWPGVVRVQAGLAGLGWAF